MGLDKWPVCWGELTGGFGAAIAELMPSVHVRTATYRSDSAPLCRIALFRFCDYTEFSIKGMLMRNRLAAGFSTTLLMLTYPGASLAQAGAPFVTVTVRSPYRADARDLRGYALSAKGLDEFETSISPPTGWLGLTASPQSVIVISLQSRANLKPIFRCDLEGVGGTPVRVDGTVTAPGHGGTGHDEQVGQRGNFTWAAEHPSNGTARAQLTLRIFGTGAIRFRGCEVRLIR